MHSDILNVEEVLELLKIKDKRLGKIQRIGKHEAGKAGSQTDVIQMENEISRDLVIESAHLLKNYYKKAFISPEFSQEMRKRK